jgi:phosphoribosylaminoimidazolecarboxamide formyltransferase/IMP cyclohydrolase
MSDTKRIRKALVSVFHKDQLEPLIRQLHTLGIELYSTGGTQAFIEDLGIPVTAIETLTSYPSIFGGRVKTLHPKVFGGILARRALQDDMQQAAEYGIPMLDLVIVDLYPFEDTVAGGGTQEEIIEKIDIGGISLIRAAAKNFNDTLVVSSRNQYSNLLQLLEKEHGNTSLADRKAFAKAAFDTSSHYDTAIFNYFKGDTTSSFKQSIQGEKTLRYGENPHQQGVFYGDLNALFEQKNGKELSYNNLLDLDAAIHLMADFTADTPAFAILKHNNACGMAVRPSVKEAYLAALAGDPVSAFGGILICNQPIDLETAKEMDQLFFEICIAPDYDADAIALLCQKKNRIVLVQKATEMPKKQFRTLLNGVIEQDKDLKTDGAEDFDTVTSIAPSAEQINDLIFAAKLVKHTKSNAIVLAKDGQLLASGTGQTSRVDALQQAIHKANHFGFDLNGAAMASDAFFPFPDCVEIASKSGIKAVVQPGGSIKDQLSIDACNKNEMTMVFTGSRHFKH